MPASTIAKAICIVRRKKGFLLIFVIKRVGGEAGVGFGELRNNGKELRPLIWLKIFFCLCLERSVKKSRLMIPVSGGIF
jgi:hypothetical protein